MTGGAGDALRVHGRAGLVRNSQRFRECGTCLVYLTEACQRCTEVVQENRPQRRSVRWSGSQGRSEHLDRLLIASKEECAVPAEAIPVDLGLWAGQASRPSPLGQEALSGSQVVSACPRLRR